MAINILSIGNSFSQDAQRYLSDLARLNGENLQTVNLFIGGCPLEKHFRNFESDARVYDLQINGHGTTGFFTTIKEALLARSWDYVTLQQASPLSYRFETYEPYLSVLASAIRKYCPKAKILMHETWAYESGSSLIHQRTAFEFYEEMFAPIRKSYLEAAKRIQADGIIYSGSVFLEAQKIFPKIHRDGMHASFDLGRFLLALTWFSTIYKKPVSDLKFDFFDHLDPFELTAEDIRKAKETVDRVLKEKAII